MDGETSSAQTYNESM